jgi:polyisoprenoid-binding protein YceI
MKKTIRILGIITFLAGIAVFIVQCKKDDSTKYVKVYGTVTLNDATVADGAIVILSKTANAADVIAKTITDTAGKYTITGINEGAYFLSAKYEPSNNNNLKSAGTVILTGPEAEVKVSGDTKADFVINALAPSGTAIIDITNGWIYDATHSTIEFQFPFDGTNAVFTGHFATTGLDVLHFDEANPANTHISAWVDITSVETGAPSNPCEHGRDGITGCIVSTLKVQKDKADTVQNYCSNDSVLTNWPNETLVSFDLWGTGTSTTTYKKQHSIVNNTGVATFKITSVTAYGTGYVAKADFTFAGVTKSVNLYFNYLEGYSKDNTAGTSNVKYVSLYGFFKFAALSDFGISSGHIGVSDVTVKISVQLNKTTPK